MRLRISIFAIAALAASFAMPARAAAPTITVAQARSLVDGLITYINGHYVFPEKRAAIVDALKKGEAAGRYDITNPGVFCETLTADLYAASHDRHMWVHFTAPVAAPPKDAKAADAGPAPDPAEDTYRHNQGYEEMRILPGNVRYTKLTGFMWIDNVTTGVVAEVAKFLSGGDAIVVDLRGNGGGSADAVKAIVSYFFAPKKQLLITFHEGNTAKDSYVLTDLAGPRLTGKPLYVLIDGGTGSASEEFAYHVKNFKLGTLVGRTTAGAANNNDVMEIPPGFEVSVSTGRPVHPVTGTNWEGVGVPPDVDVPSDDALDTALMLALKKLAKDGAPRHRTEYQWYVTDFESRSHRPMLSAAQLDVYAGQYGVRRLWVENGVLHFQREQREPATLTAMADDLFQFGNDPDVRARFNRKDGKITGFDMLTADGQSIPVARTQ